MKKDHGVRLFTGKVEITREVAKKMDDAADEAVRELEERGQMIYQAIHNDILEAMAELGDVTIVQVYEAVALINSRWKKYEILQGLDDLILDDKIETEDEVFRCR